MQDLTLSKHIHDPEISPTVQYFTPTPIFLAPCPACTQEVGTVQ